MIISFKLLLAFSNRPKQLEPSSAGVNLRSPKTRFKHKLDYQRANGFFGGRRFTQAEVESTCAETPKSPSPGSPSAARDRSSSACAHPAAAKIAHLGLRGVGLRLSATDAHSPAPLRCVTPPGSHRAEYLLQTLGMSIHSTNLYQMLLYNCTTASGTPDIIQVCSNFPELAYLSERLVRMR